MHHKDEGDKYELLGYTIGHPIPFNHGNELGTGHDYGEAHDFGGNDIGGNGGHDFKGYGGGIGGMHGGWAPGGGSGYGHWTLATKIHPTSLYSNVQKFIRKLTNVNVNIYQFIP